MEYNLEIQTSTPHHKQLPHIDFHTLVWTSKLQYNGNFFPRVTSRTSNKEDFKLIPI
jgi:hypothetical protein